MSANTLHQFWINWELYQDKNTAIHKEKYQLTKWLLLLSENGDKEIQQAIKEHGEINYIELMEGLRNFEKERATIPISKDVVKELIEALKSLLKCATVYENYIQKDKNGDMGEHPSITKAKQALLKAGVS